MKKYKFDLNNFKKHFEKFSYNFLRLMIITFFFSIGLFVLFYTTQDDIFLSLFLIIFCGSLICLLVTLAYIDNLKRKNKESVLKIDYENAYIDNYKILKITNYVLNSREIILYGYFENNTPGNLFNYQKYILNVNIPRQYENESDIISQIESMKNKEFYNVDCSKYIQVEFNKKPLIVSLIISIIIFILGILVSNILLIALPVVILIIDLLILAFYTIDHKNDSLIFEDDYIEYENCYVRDEDGHIGSLKKYVRKYKISNIKKIKKGIFLTIYGDVDYKLYRINSFEKENIDNSLIIKSYKFDKITILNLFKEKELILKNINKYLK